MEPSEKKALQYLIDVSRQPKKPLVTVAGLTAILEALCGTSDQGCEYMLSHGLLEILTKCMEEYKAEREDYRYLLVLAALRVTWRISVRRLLVGKPLANERFFERLLQFIKIKGEFFSFSDDFHNGLETLILRKKLIANVISEDVPGDLTRHFLDKGVVNHTSALPKQIQRCLFFDTSGDRDIDIAERLIMENKAWPPPVKSEPQDDCWKDILVVKLLPDNYFYALIGEAAIRQAAAMKSIIEDMCSDLTSASIEENKIVLVALEIDSQVQYVRSQVISNRKGCWVKVMLLDIGGTSDVLMDNVFELPSALSLMYFPALASFCRLSGISPKPYNRNVCELVLTSLCNLIKRNTGAGLTLQKINCLPHLLNMLQCPDAVLVMGAVRLLSNMASNPRSNRYTFDFEKVLLNVLDCLRTLRDKSWSRTLKNKISYGSFCCISNILYMDKGFRSYFHQNEGLPVVLGVMAQHCPSDKNYSGGTRLLSNFLWVNTDKRTSSTSTISRLKPASESVNDTGFPKAQKVEVVQERVKSMRVEDFSSSENEEEELKSKQPSKQEVSPEPDLSKKQSLDRFQKWKQLLTRKQSESSDKNQLDVAKVGVTSLQDKSAISDSNPVRPINCAESVKESRKYYIADEVVEFSDDSTHAIRPQLRVEDACANDVAQIVCGMLNSRGGTIYFGIVKETHQVQGIALCREKRDSFRLGVDQMMTNKFHPTVLIINSDMAYVPVCQYTRGKLQGKVEQVADLYVIEIHVRPSRGMLHSTGSKYFYRWGPTDFTLSTQEVRELAVVGEEARYKEEILHLRRQLQELKNGLVSENSYHS